MDEARLTELLYEQAKRVLRQMLPPEVQDRQGRPFVMACHECGLAFRNDVEMGMVAEHGKLEHGLDAVGLDMVFIGEGPPPKGQPT